MLVRTCLPGGAVVLRQAELDLRAIVKSGSPSALTTALIKAVAGSGDQGATAVFWLRLSDGCLEGRVYVPPHVTFDPR
jgi:hypothetical protein